MKPRVTLLNGQWQPVRPGTPLSQMCKYCGRPCSGGGRVRHQKACLRKRERARADKEFWA